jgi:hypothetical protein
LYETLKLFDFFHFVLVFQFFISPSIEDELSKFPEMKSSSSEF